jgi:hypothetical protein
MTFVFGQVGAVRVVETTCFGSVQRGGDRIARVGDAGPVAPHHVVGRAAEQNLVGLAEPGGGDPHLVVVGVRHHPAAVPEAVTGVLVDAAGSLHDAVEGEEGVHGELHRVSLRLSGCSYPDVERTVPGSTPDFRLLWRLRRIPLAIKLAARDET